MLDKRRTVSRVSEQNVFFLFQSSISFHPCANCCFCSLFLILQNVKVLVVSWIFSFSFSISKGIDYCLEIWSTESSPHLAPAHFIPIDVPGSFHGPVSSLQWIVLLISGFTQTELWLREVHITEFWTALELELTRLPAQLFSCRDGDLHGIGEGWILAY